mgnify:FL=1
MNIDFANENVVQNISNLTITKRKEKVSKKQAYVYIKRIIDCITSSIALILLLPIFLIIAIAIKLDSKGPIFFAHTRIGKNGKIIKIYKFRTMVVNAEELIKKFTPEQMKEYKENYKLNNDPRITKVGNILRKTSLDELPQLINIIKGDLALIGPRPVVNAELEKYGENASKFLSVTPGLTGNWAANGRSISAYEERMQLELYYVDNMSLKMDIEIFFKTIIAVIKREGAM